MNDVGEIQDQICSHVKGCRSKVFYDPAEQVSSLLHTPLAGSSVAESAHHYVYDTAGNIGSKQVEKPGLAATMTTYGHNSLNQLTAIGGSGGVKTVVVRGDTSEPASVKVKPGTSSTWKDAKMLQGQRFEADVDLATGPNQINVQAKDGSNNTSNYTYALDLAAASASTPTYDADGNMTSDGVRGYEWDMQNRLVKITWGAGSNKSTEFRYNALGQRSERIELTGTTEDARHYYLYDGIHYLCRYTGGTASANIDHRYFNEGEQRKNGAAWDGYYYTRDHLGSIREVLASNGTLVARYDYDPYGKRSTQYEASGYVCDLGYTGHITQPSPVTGQTELVMTLFRAYVPDLGRWLSADPIGEAGGLNLYRYVDGTPIRRTDPLGLFVNVENPLVNPDGPSAADFGTCRAPGYISPGEIALPFAVYGIAAAGVYGIAEGGGAIIALGLTRADLIRIGPTVVSNQLAKGAGTPGATVVKNCIKGGGGKLPWHFHIHRFNWYKPWMWFKNTPIIRP